MTICSSIVFAASLRSDPGGVFDRWVDEPVTPFSDIACVCAADAVRDGDPSRRRSLPHVNKGSAAATFIIFNSDKQGIRAFPHGQSCVFRAPICLQAGEAGYLIPVPG